MTVDVYHIGNAIVNSSRLLATKYFQKLSYITGLVNSNMADTSFTCFINIIICARRTGIDICLKKTRVDWSIVSIKSQTEQKLLVEETMRLCVESAVRKFCQF